MRLNKYIAHTGHCTRREASRLLMRGEIKVNGQVVKEESYRVMEGDVITHKNQPLIEKKTYRYLLINKPKKFSTDIEDKDSKYIMGLIKKSDPEGLIAVDEMGPTSIGLLLLTDDKELAEKLSDAKRNIKRVYHIVLDKEINDADIKKLTRTRKTLAVDTASHIEGFGPEHLGIQMTIGSEKILTQTIERMDYKVLRIDRSYYAGLTKKDLKRGWSRPLKEMEERMMKHFI